MITGDAIADSVIRRYFITRKKLKCYKKKEFELKSPYPRFQLSWTRSARVALITAIPNRSATRTSLAHTLYSILHETGAIIFLLNYFFFITSWLLNNTIFTMKRITHLTSRFSCLIIH